MQLLTRHRRITRYATRPHPRFHDAWKNYIRIATATSSLGGSDIEVDIDRGSLVRNAIRTRQLLYRSGLRHLEALMLWIKTSISRAAGDRRGTSPRP